MQSISTGPSALSNQELADATKPNHVTDLKNETASPSSSDAEDGGDSLDNVDHEFVKNQCLFCNHMNTDLDMNLKHMSKVHGLHVETRHLLVDIETLLAYFFLIISGYHECLFCGTQRNTREAVQQHMVAKSHCKFDLTDEASEIRDFYELDVEIENTTRRVEALSMADSQFLPRNAKKPQAYTKGLNSSPNNSTRGTVSSTPIQGPTSTESTGSQALSQEQTLPLNKTSSRSQSQKQGHTLNTQLARLRANDRRSLMHLPASEQRALLEVHQKQLQKAQKEERRMHARTERMGNKTLMKHFVADVPGRANG